jgi:hypothetical protein
MYLGFVIGNILQKFSHDPYNIIYNPQNNLFDHTLSANNRHQYFIINDNIQSFGNSNMMSLKNKNVSLFNYNLHITNNILGYTNQNLKNFHINSIIVTHSGKPAYIKKEDLSLMNQRLGQEAKIFFTKSAAESWRFNNSILMRYGIPEVFGFNKLTEDRKDVLILNYDNNPQVNQIKTALESSNYSCDIMTSCFLSTETINDTFNNYKVCIDLAEHNIINLLCSIASGCIGISMKPQYSADEYSDIEGLVFINGLNELNKVISNNVSVNSEQRKSNSKNVLGAFDFMTFKKSIDSIIEASNKEAFSL